MECCHQEVTEDRTSAAATWCKTRAESQPPEPDGGI